MRLPKSAVPDSKERAITAESATEAQRAQKKILTFVALTFALSSVFYYLIGSAGGISAVSGLYVLGLMWCPGVAALLTSLLLQRNLRGLGWGWGKTRYQLCSYALPLGYAAAVYLPVWLLGLGALNTEALANAASRWGIDGLPTGLNFVVVLIIVGTAGMLGSCLSALGEEIGWRGLLVPELAKLTTLPRAGLISGGIWALWHYPLVLFFGYQGGTPRWYSLICFTVMILGISVAFAWIRIQSGSLWTAMFLHASHNVFIQNFFDPLTMDTGPTEWVIGEFGAGLAIVGAAVGFLFLRMNRNS